MTSVAHVMEQAGRAVLGTAATLAFTRDVTRRLLEEGVPGDLVECGVAAGAHPAVMAAVLAEARDPRRSVHLYDSFEGIPHAGPEDDATILGCIGGPQDGALVSTGVSAQSERQVRENLVSWGVPIARCLFHAGWFQVTVSAEDPRCIALLRLDGDLYESTRVCLEALYPRVSTGGVVIVDDWLLTGCRRAVVRYLEARGELADIRAIEGGQGPIWWTKRAVG